MNSPQLLLPIYRALRPVVDLLRLNAPARRIWAALWNPQPGQLVRARQNGRVWRLSPEVALRGAEQEMDTVRWLGSIIEPGATVIDVGANVGQMTLEMAHLVGATGRVIAIEPGPGNLALLRRHVEANGFSSRVQIVAAACGGVHSGECELRIYGGEVGAVGSGFQVSEHGLNRNPIAANRQVAIRVPRVSLDGICGELNLRPSVIKIDVEGSEIEVLRGASRVLRECRPRVRFGFHPFAFPDPKEAQDEIAEMLRAAGLGPPSPRDLPWGLMEVEVP
jgi:FkbM family methyltransferase